LDQSSLGRVRKQSSGERRAKFYELTRLGRKQLEREESAWRKLAAAVAQILETT